MTVAIDFASEVRAWASQFTHANAPRSAEAYWNPGPACATRGSSTLCLTAIYGEDGAITVTVCPYGDEGDFTEADWAACEAPIALAKSVLRENGLAVQD